VERWFEEGMVESSSEMRGIQRIPPAGGQEKLVTQLAEG
jgi:hypothetical protein